MKKIAIGALKALLIAILTDSSIINYVKNKIKTLLGIGRRIRKRKKQ